MAALEAFRLRGDGHEIRQGVLELLRLCPRVEGALAPDFWKCPYRGKLMAVCKRTCAHCNAPPDWPTWRLASFWLRVSATK